MRHSITQSLLRTAAVAVPALFAAAAAQAATSVALTAARTQTVLPDGSTVPMWGYTCAAGSTNCAASNLAAGANWSPVVITVPTDSTGFGSLTVALTNNLPVPTSLVIPGQIGTETGNAGGGTTDVPRIAFPQHAGQGAITWPAVDPSAAFAPPSQKARAGAFAAETAANTGTLTYTWSKLRPGTYLIESGSLTSLQEPMGLYGVVVVTQAPAAANATAGTAALAGDAYPNKATTGKAGMAYDADAVLLFSEIDPRQNAAVDAAAQAGADVTIAANDPACTFNGGATACYPPVVNYAPTYFLINGTSFDPTLPANSGVAFSGNTAVAGQVLVRMANAGSRTHVPTIVGQALSLVAEDGNLAPGVPKKQTHVLLPAGKTYDATATLAATAGAYATASFPLFDRALSLTSGNLDKQSVLANSGMMAFLAMQPAGTAVGATGGAGVPAGLLARAVADTYATPFATPFNGDVATNDVNVKTVTVAGAAPCASDPTLSCLTTASGTVAIAPNGAFTYTPSAAVTTKAVDGFDYVGNGDPLVTAHVTITIGSSDKPTAVADAFTSAVSSQFHASAPGVLGNDGLLNSSNVILPLGLTAQLASKGSCASVDLLADGSFTAVPVAGAASCSFTYQAISDMNVASNVATSTVTFVKGSGLPVVVQDTQDQSPQADYAWVIEEDSTFFHDPKNPTAVNTLSTNFHHSYMRVVATGCTGPNSCGDSNSVTGGTFVAKTRSFPADVVLDPAKRYYISVLPGDADQGDGQYDANGNLVVNAYGHAMGGVMIPALCTPVAPATTCTPAAGTTYAQATVLVPRNPLPPSQISVIVFEDNNPTNGGVDDGEQGLGGFTVNFYDTRGSSGDPAGLMTYDMSAMPFSNWLANQKDSATGVNLCPMNSPSGTIITCPELDARGQPSPLAGMALVKNINPGRYDVWATPGADRAVKGENWIQVSTLEGTPANDTFVKPGEPPYWQEFGPPGFHSFIGFVNPDHIKAVNNQQRGKSAIVTGRVPSLHMSRPRPLNNIDPSLANSCATGLDANGVPTNPADPTCRATLAATVCYAALNSQAGTAATIAMTTCDQNGNFTFADTQEPVPPGQYELVIWDQWLDQIIAYKAVTVPPATPTVNVGDVPVFSWFTRVSESAFQDTNQNGVRDAGEPGVAQVPMNIRFRDGSISNFLATDSSGSVTTSELFPLFNWYVLESDTTRYTGTGVFTVYDAGGKVDAAATSVTDLNGAAVTKNFAGQLNSKEPYPLAPADQIPTSKYTPNSTARIDAGTTLTEATQGYINQTAIVDWGKRPYVPGENGGITGMVYYASTRGFDDPSLEVQFSWEPGIPNVLVNLYREVKAADGSVTRVLVDQTKTWSWDDAATTMKCPGEPDYDPTRAAGDPFINVTMAQAQVAKGLPAASAKTACYDGQHSFNQIQPGVYDGRYKFPSAACSVPGGTFTPAGSATAVSCATVANPANDAKVLPGKPASVTYPAVLPNGNYIVELVIPPGYEIVKEEDKNILIGDAYVAPYQNTQFMGVGNVFIVPDQATLNDANTPGDNLAAAFPSCVGAPHLVPDYLTIFPDNQQVSPYAGQLRPLCDHKEVGVTDQGQGGADFQLFTFTPVAGHISGIMLNDAAAEFDPYNPAFLEKASLPNAPISVRDYNGVEIERVYNDRYGTFNQLVPSTWDANVPNPSGYAPNMLTYCMNDPGPIKDTRQFLADGVTANPTFGQMITDPLYNPMFSNFCYNWPAMPGITTYLDTPVLPVSAFASASSYEPVDCAYPAGTPSIFRVDGTDKFVNSAKTNIGPVVDLAIGRTLVITALGDVQVPNPGYEGPNAVNDATHPTATQPKVTRHYGFGTTPGTVKVGNLTLAVAAGGWTDTKITATVPAGFNGNLADELVVTTSTGAQSIDTVTVTIGSNVAATYVAPPVAGTSGSTTLAHPIQDAVDAAKAGDLIVVDGGNYSELVVMYKPVRLQGVGAAATVINATKYPNQKLDQWRTKVNALFGLDDQGNQLPGTPAVDPLPGQEITGGVVLLEPSVLATEEGAGITVLAKGYRADGTTLLGSGRQDCGFTGNFLCQPSRIDGLSVTGGDSGGGIYVNGWAHNLEIANNRVYGNAGPLAAGIRIGQPYLEGQALTEDFTGFGYDQNVRVHHNAITNNGTVEGNAAAGALAATAGGAGGGLSICAGSDGYKVTGNWVCGNYSSSDGGGIGHIGLSNGGLIQGNKILFNESYNQTGSQFGGGLVVEGEGATGTTLSLGTGNVTIDQNLIQGNFARAGSGGGIRLQSVNGGEIGVLRVNRNDPNSGHWNVTVTNNMIVNNVAAWAGAGISLADTLYSNIVGNTVAVNDSTGIAGNLFNTQVGASNTGPTTAVPNPAGISTELTSAALYAAAGNNTANRISDPHLVNNVVWHNRSFFFNMQGTVNGLGGQPQLSPGNTWAAAVGTPQSLGTPGANGCNANDTFWDVGVVGDLSVNPGVPANITTGFASWSQAGNNPRVVTVNTKTVIGLTIGSSATATITGITGNGSGRYNRANVAITITGASQFTYSPSNGGVNNLGSLGIAAASVTVTPPANPAFPVGNSLVSGGTDPGFVKLYCNASRAQPGLQFEPGTPFQPAFNISVSATLDESGNFVDLHFGPLSSVDLATGTVPNGDYHLAGAAGGAYNTGGAPTTGLTPYTAHDYDGDARPLAGSYDMGADEYRAPAPVAGFSPTALAFGAVSTGTSKPLSVTVSNTGNLALNVTGVSLSAGTPASYTVSNGCTAAVAVNGTCTITVTFAPTTGGAANGNLVVTTNDPNAASTTIALSGTGAVTLSPGSWNAGSQTRNCPGTNFAQRAACALDPATTFIFTNTGTTSLTSVTPSITGTNAADFAYRPNVSLVAGPRCSQVNGTNRQLAPGATCSIVVQFQPQTSEAAGTKTATLSVASGLGTVTATLQGTAN